MIKAFHSPAARQLITRYDRVDTLLAVSVYPNEGETYSAGKSGVASYTKNAIKSMDHSVVVLCEYDKEPVMYEEGNTLVIRCFQNGSPVMYAQIHDILSQFSAARRILVQYDFAVYGNALTNGLMLPYLAFLKLTGFTVFVTLHHVVDDIRKLSGHVGLTDSPFDQCKAALYDLGFIGFYSMLDRATNGVIVLEDFLKDHLSKYIPAEKIYCIPHGVDTSLKTPSKSHSREELHLPKDAFVVLFFGYVNWFKGADLFAKFYANVSQLLGKQAIFIMAGGESATMRRHGYYRKFYAETLKTVNGAKSMTLTGYVPQKKLGKYFAASDIVVMPYRHLMTASGVLSLILSYKKPFLVGKPIKDMFESDDFREAFRKARLSSRDVAFGMNSASCVAATEKVLKNGLKRKMRNVAATMRQKRDYRYISGLYERVIFVPSYKLSPSTGLRYT